MILEKVILCALFAYGMFTLQRPGFMLHWLRSIWKNFPSFLHEPLFDCGVCVASIWGGGSYLYMIYIQGNQYFEYLVLPVFLGATVGGTAIIDRAVKSFEKSYGYKAPSTKKGESKWDYLLPFTEVRRMMVNAFIKQHLDSGDYVVEICGHNPKYQDHKRYVSFNSNDRFSEKNYHHFMNRMRCEETKYVVVILGLCFEGDLRLLKKFISESAGAIIEYSDDGISKLQIDLITENIKTKYLIPEYTIASEEVAPSKCGTINKRRVLILQPK